MAISSGTYSEKDRLRSYSSIFTRRVFNDIIRHSDFSYIDTIANRYDGVKIEQKTPTYIDYIKYVYRSLSKNYKCEYLYKNTIINELLIKAHGTKNTIAINEFRVKNSIVDIALFNGVSRAFEIKTELDNDQRLLGQLSDYTRLFQECYVVVPLHMVQKYIDTLDDNIGIDALSCENGKIKIHSIRKAITNKTIDVDVLIHSLRTNEYKNIVKRKFGVLPKVSCFEMFDACLNIISNIPPIELHQMFIDEIKKRSTNTQQLTKYKSELRQICLSLNLSLSDYEQLYTKLNNQIIQK